MAVFSPLKKILDFIIYSNLFISLGVACFTLQTALFFPAYASILEEFSVLNFIATFILYNLQRLYYASNENINEKYSWYIRNRRFLFTAMVLLLLCFFNRLLDFFLQHYDYFFAYLFFAALSVFYFLPPVQLRKYGTLKPFIIAFVFVSVSILIPLYSVLSLSVIGYAIGQLCFVAVLCMLFDVKDLQHDQAFGVKTFPVKLGLKKTKYASALLLLAYCCSALVTLQPQALTAYIIISVFTLFLILLTKATRQMYYFFYLVDGLIFLQYFLLQALVQI